MSVAPAPPPTRPPRRTALLVGINYLNTDNELNGCYNDVVNVAQYLRTVLGYVAPGAISIITDGNRNRVGTASPLPPTRQNILAGMAALVDGMVAGDEAVFHFSGHGSLVRDTNGDEATGLDSCLCPIDYDAPSASGGGGGGVVTDDEIRALLVDRVPRGARLYVILDCCHNGSGCDIRYKYEDFSILVRERPTPLWRTQQRAFVNPKYTDTAGEVFMISGSRDEQTSADAYINNAYAGALTYAVFAILRANQAAIRTYSWSALLRDVRHFMRVNKYTQIPQIMTGQIISPARAVFSAVAAAGAGSVYLELTTGSNSVGRARGTTASAGAAAAAAAVTNGTLFGFKGNFGSIRPRKAQQQIQFIH
jgi:metacaspase-1